MRMLINRFDNNHTLKGCIAVITPGTENLWGKFYG